MKKICIVAGARPNFIKVAPLIRAIDRTDGICYRLVYTGRSDDPTLEDSLFSDLQIPHPDAFLDADCENLNELTGKVMSAFEHYIENNPADVVIVVDDLASTMAAAIVTKKQGLKLAHLVAGTRSFDIKMPKEINRLVIDGLSDLLFTAGMSNNSITNREGTEQSRVYMVGNILIDNLRFIHSRWQRPAVFDDLSLCEGEYLVFTLNRKALLSDVANLQSMLQAMVTKAGSVPIVAPLRGKAKDIVCRLLAEMEFGSRVSVIEPLGYLEFGYLTSHAKGIITDSGNVAEEATFNAVPCITLNSYTEHIETVKVGTNVLVGEDAEQLSHAVDAIVSGCCKPCAIPERWDGRSAERIVSILLNV
ncbi:MAG: UDP-N-acetyl glucosamine 2-epimerase [Prevotella sp.]|uniref:UDP-N-acetyl glucosamine 2-epimerase n=1 Tax=Prevotella sp. TaxID=59823 RepID=UPI002A2E68C3|nr:UDP-N-acetyl glucosamine 2-epimerase [Prevotella sp.]MDD7317630.1 UDP-N-acetyl glucosamine 2-epimerase [Prevotellaceae bacterium]MDY4020523.1 UDP-N-acetyl glucosamine 2-epimerase [Prevotella sp.]